MVDRTPQQFPDGEPDGTTDNTAAIQAAIDAWQPGDRVVLAGGTFRTSAPIQVPSDNLVVTGDAVVRALAGFSGAEMFAVTATGVVFDGDGLEIDQDDKISGGASILATAAVGIQVLNVVSRGSQKAFLLLADDTTDLVLAGCDHLGKGYGVLGQDVAGLTRLTFRDSVFAHSGGGGAGDGIQFNCPTFGASEVTVVGCTASGYVGEATNQGMGFGFAGVTDGRIVGCRAENCEGDGFHFEHGSHRWLCADLIAVDVGIADPVGGNGSGLIAYDSDDITVVLMLARNCGFHGIALSGQGENVTPQLRLNGLIERCSIDTTRRDGIHLTAQKDFRVDRNAIRDPSLGNPNTYAGIHVGRQGGTTLENTDGVGTGNAIVLSGATVPLDRIVIRPESAGVAINGLGPAGVLGGPWADGTFWSDATGWQDAA